jgi:hypothetical protein
MYVCFNIRILHSYCMLSLKSGFVLLIAGDQLPCPNDTRSETGLTPGCTSNFC